MSTQTTDTHTEVPDEMTTATTIPPLRDGDRLSEAEFLRRYARHPEIKKAELLNGVVYVGSPVHYQQHGLIHIYVSTWLGTYIASTPGLDGGDNTTLRLASGDVVQPDGLLRLDAALGGRSSITPDDYLTGVPELLVEVTATTTTRDMQEKQRIYAHHGIPEYLVIQTAAHQVVWGSLHGDDYHPLEPASEGILRSGVFPGLWLDTGALLAGNIAGVLACLQQGIASLDHQTFVEHLQKK